eukprot:TRINITY_DN60504_c0_g1_i1.p1 TRINITY_DN60504_c0_g1~~TRINITY_DN60504_c0_g1_i1.p1  ORF type:complete len:153 (-),score=37.11 TRINITY_DN60504_c0_g1_i1:266-724(-)
MDLLGALQQEQQLPPELLQVMEPLEALDSEFRAVSLPLQRLQYSCGFKRCFGGESGGGLMGRLGSFGTGGGSAQKTLLCLERCEAPIHEFEEACERRMDGLIGELEQCMQDMGEQARLSCVSRAMEPSRLHQVVQKLSADVKNIQQKYMDLE